MSSPSVLTTSKCKVRILIVADGGIHFKSTEDGFSLSEFVAALQEPVRTWEDLEITVAIREADLDSCTQHPNFIFSSDFFNIANFDQVWLFGRLVEEGPPVLKESELKCFYDFMNQGGGVFATGDHESLGAALCSQVPRVLSMRKWLFKDATTAALKAPGQGDVTRLDTLRMGLTPGFQLTDQADKLPQEIRPKFFVNAGGASFPHPLLGDGDFAITVLPDHMHEGECMIPEELTNHFGFGGPEFDEYPLWPNNLDRSRPEAVAISTSAGGALTQGGILFPPVEPRSFYAIVAYDGHLVEVQDVNNASARIGRVVVDSSFHHFVDLNVKGFKDDEGKPTRDLIAFKKYYRNIVSWLVPARRKVEYYTSLLLHVRFSGPLMAELPTTPPFSLEEILRAGSLTQGAITAALSRGEAIACVLTMLGGLPPEQRTEIEQLINPWLPPQLRELGANPILSSDFFVNLILGNAILNVSSTLPNDIFAAGKELIESESLREKMSSGIAEGVQANLGSLLDVVRLSRQALANLKQPK